MISARLELAAQARIDGDLRYHTLEMAAGAQVNGRISRQAEETRRELPAPARRRLRRATHWTRRYRPERAMLALVRHAPI